MTSFDIPAGEIHLWWASLDVSDQEVAHLRTYLDDRELERADRFRVPNAARRFIAARAILRLLLGRATGIEPTDLEFRLGAHGKPYLFGQGPFFNASDSGDYVVVALASVEVGVDIEVVRQLDRYERLAHRICTEQELDALARVPDNERSTAILRLWTCKEASLKAIGTGLPGGLRNVEVGSFWNEPPRLSRLLGDTEGWAVLFPDLLPGVLCTVVARGHDLRVVDRRFVFHST